LKILGRDLLVAVVALVTAALGPDPLARVSRRLRWRRGCIAIGENDSGGRRIGS